MPKFCATRTACISTLSALLSKYVEVIRALEIETVAQNDAASHIRRLEGSYFDCFTVCLELPWLCYHSTSNYAVISQTLIMM